MKAAVGVGVADGVEAIVGLGTCAVGDGAGVGDVSCEARFSFVGQGAAWVGVGVLAGSSALR